jgi:hypothetical protein
MDPQPLALMSENSSDLPIVPASTPWEVAADARMAALHDRLAEFERRREEMLSGYGVDQVGAPERGVLPAGLRWFMHMQEVVRKAGMTRLEVLDEMVDRHANRVRLGRLSGIAVALVSTALSVVLTVAMTALFSHLFPAPSPMGRP